MKIYVKISDKMSEKLDYYADEFGMSKSSFVAYALANHIRHLDYEANTYKGVTDLAMKQLEGKPQKGDFDDVDIYIN